MADAMRQRNEHELILQLAAAETVRRAARLSGFSERTAHRRLEDSEFAQHVRQTRADMVQRAAGRLSHAIDEAVLTLRNLTDTDQIKSYFDQEEIRRAVVVGAGFIGL